MIDGAVVNMVDTERFIHKTRFVLLRQGKPDDALRDKFRIGNRGKRELFKDSGSLKAPLLASDSVLERYLDGIGVQHIARKLIAHQVSVLVFAQDCYGGESIFFQSGNTLPMKLEALQRFRYAAIVGIQCEEELASSLLHAAVEGRGLALIFLKKIADRETGLGLPLGD